MCIIKGYNDYVDLGVYGVYGWVLNFKNRGVSSRTVSDWLKYDEGPMSQYRKGTTLIVSSNCVVCGINGYDDNDNPEYYIRAYFYGMFSVKFVSRKILGVVGASTNKKSKSNKVVLKVSYVTCKGLEKIIFEFDVSEIKLKA